jgi:hypothetical protein
MPEPVRAPQDGRCFDPAFSSDHLDPRLLQNTALRYAARDLNPSETVAFEARLADDQLARDALSEAVRLSAAALGQDPPTPHHSFRTAISERLLGWCPGWLTRRAYRGHPLAWAGLGAATVASCLILGLTLDQSEQKSAIPSTANNTSARLGSAGESNPDTLESHLAGSEVMAFAPMPREHGGIMAQTNCNDDHAGKPSVAEIWAELSTPDHVEKTHEEELRWRQKLREMGTTHPGRPSPTASINEPREP